MTEKFAALKEGSWADFYSTNEPVCPHCGTSINPIDHEIWCLFEEGTHDIECPHCDEEFSVSAHARFTYNTDEQND